MLNSKQNDSKKMSRNECLLILGRVTSKIGNIIFDYSNQILLVYIFQEKTFILAIYQGAEVIFGSAFNMIGGVVSDISEKKKLVVLTDLLSAFVCLLTGFLTLNKNIAIIVILANSVLAIINSFNSPTYKSIVRELVVKERVHIYNSISNAGYEIISIVAPLLGVLLIDCFGVQGALYFDGFTFLASAFIEMFFKSIHPQIGSCNKKFWGEFKNGICYISKEKEILYLVVVSSAVNFVLSGYNLLIPYTELIYNNSSSFFSKVMISEAMGSIIGASLISKTKGRVIKIWQLIFGMASSFCLIPVFRMMPTVILKLIPFGLCGIFATMFNITYVSILQIKVDFKFQGRVFGIIQGLVTIFMPLGALFFSKLPLICESFYIIGIIMVIISLCSFFLSYIRE